VKFRELGAEVCSRDEGEGPDVGETKPEGLDLVRRALLLCIDQAETAFSFDFVRRLDERKDSEERSKAELTPHTKAEELTDPLDSVDLDVLVKQLRCDFEEGKAGRAAQGEGTGIGEGEDVSFDLDGEEGEWSSRGGGGGGREGKEGGHVRRRCRDARSGRVVELEVVVRS